MIKDNIKTLTMMVVVIALSGCAAGFDEEYSCKSVGGISGCVTMNEMRNMGSAINTSDTGHNPINAVAAENINTAFSLLPRRNKFGHPTRTLDEVQKVTVFPFVEKNGLYVDTTDLYIVLDDRHWSGRPVQAIRQD